MITRISPKKKVAIQMIARIPSFDVTNFVTTQKRKEAI